MGYVKKSDRQKVDEEKERRLISKKDNEKKRVAFDLFGEVRQKFFNECIREGKPESEMARKIFRFYYDNHPNSNNTY